MYMCSVAAPLWIVLSLGASGYKHLDLSRFLMVLPPHARMTFDLSERKAEGLSARNNSTFDMPERKAYDL